MQIVEKLERWLQPTPQAQSTLVVKKERKVVGLVTQKSLSNIENLALVFFKNLLAKFFFLRRHHSVTNNNNNRTVHPTNTEFRQERTKTVENRLVNNLG